MSDCDPSAPPFLAFLQAQKCLGEDLWVFDNDIMGLVTQDQVLLLGAMPGAFEVHEGVEVEAQSANYSSAFVDLTVAGSFQDSTTTTMRCGEGEWALALVNGATVVECYTLGPHDWRPNTAIPAPYRVCEPWPAFTGG